MYRMDCADKCSEIKYGDMMSRLTCNDMPIVYVQVKCGAQTPEQRPMFFLHVLASLCRLSRWYWPTPHKCESAFRAFAFLATYVVSPPSGMMGWPASYRVPTRADHAID